MTTTTNNPKIQDLGWLVPVGYAVDGTVRFTCKPIRATNDNIPMEYLLVGTKFQAVDGTRWFITSCYQPTQDDTHDRTKYVISCVRDNEPTTLDRHSKITEPLTTLRRHSNLEWDWEDTGGNCLAIVHGDMTADHGTYTMITYLEGPFTYDDERDGIHATEPIAVGTYPADDCEPLTMAYYCDWYDFITNHDFTTGIRKTTPETN